MVISSTGRHKLEISSLNPVKIMPIEEVHLRICVDHLHKGYTIGKIVKSGLIYFGDPWSFAGFRFEICTRDLHKSYFIRPCTRRIKNINQTT